MSEEIEELPTTVASSNSESIEATTENENTLKILIATDIHLGYNERDPIRGQDSFTTFEEILHHGATNEVDFIILGGDLFHESKPTANCLHRCISLLKKYCLGDRPVAIEFLSDQSKNFKHLKDPIVNYEDPNLNVSIPVFSIHGNHDDPTGENNLSAMDILADTGLVNYFGKWLDLNKIEVYPLLMRKGNTQLALYGLSHIKDERLSRLFKDKKVTMTRPLDSQNWVNILVLHQNRAQNRGVKNFIPESVLPDFLDIVIWGHEHDCRIDLEETANGIQITQPGSSVATSLAAGEALPKYIGLLTVLQDKYRLDKIKLNTVRPFIFKEIDISKPVNYDEDTPSEYAKNKIVSVVNEMIKSAEALSTPESPKLPLIRLVVNFHEDSLMSNAIRMGQIFRERVANPVEMLSFKLRKTTTRKLKNTDIFDVDLEDQSAESISELVDQYLKAQQQNLNIFSSRGLCEAVTRFIDRNDNDAFDDIMKHQFNKTIERLLQIEDVSEENYLQILEQFRLERENKPNDELLDIEKVLNDENRVRSIKNVDEITSVSSDDEFNNVSVKSGSSMNMTLSNRGAASTRPARGRGSRGPRKSRARGKAS